jgi:hypothetical protein
MGELIPIVAIVMGMLTVLIPITGFTARALLEQRVALLEQQQSNTETELEKVLEVQRFQEKLLASAEKDS